MPEILTFSSYTLQLYNDDHWAIASSSIVGLLTFIVIVCLVVICMNNHTMNRKRSFAGESKRPLKRQSLFDCVACISMVLFIASCINIHYLPPANSSTMSPRTNREMIHLKKIYRHLPNHPETHYKSYSNSISKDAKDGAGRSYHIMSKSQAIKKYRHLNVKFKDSNPTALRKVYIWNYL